jgi:hypothetical protein
MKHWLLCLTLLPLFFAGCANAANDVMMNGSRMPAEPDAVANIQMTSNPEIGTTVNSESEMTALSSNSTPTAVSLETSTATVTIEPSLTSVPIRTHTPEPTKTVTSTPLPACNVAVSSINVREGPGTQFEAIGLAQNDEQLRVIAFDASSSWFLVELNNGQIGWVAESVCAGNRALAGFPSPATIPPTYTPTPTNTPWPTPTKTPFPTATHTVVPTATRVRRIFMPITNAQDFCFAPPNDQWGTFDNLNKWEIEVFGNFSAQIEVSTSRGDNGSEPNFHSVGTGIGILDPDNRLDWSRISTVIDANLPRGSYLVETAHSRNGASGHGPFQEYQGETCDWIGNGECLAYLNFPVIFSILRANGKIRYYYEVHGQTILLDEINDNFPDKVHIYAFQLAWGESANCSTLSNWTIQELP